MTTTQWVGALIVALILAGGIAFMAVEDGWGMVWYIFSRLVAILGGIGLLLFGIYLLVGGTV